MAGETYGTRPKGKRLSRRRLLTGMAVGSAGFTAVALIGCGQRPPAPGGAAPTAKEPRRGGTLGSQTFGETPHQDPHQTASNFLHESGMGIVYSRLLRWKLTGSRYPDEIITDGDLVERWEQPDQQTYVFHLHPGVKWQNIAPVNGRELKAEDVIYSFKRQIDERVNASFLEGVEEMTATDTRTLRFKLAKPDADFLLALSDIRCKVVAPEAVELRGDLKQGPTIGTGAWIFQEWQNNQLVRLTRNPDYFRRGLPYADEKIIFRISDPQTQQAAFRTKQTHVLAANKQVQSLLKASVPDLRVQHAKLLGALGGTKVWLHAERPPTSDIRVRQAINKVIDRNVHIQTVMFGSAWLNAGIFVPSADWLLPEEELKKLLGQALAEARRLLAAAGLTSWSPTVKNGPQNVESRQAGELFVSQLRSANIMATLAPVDNVQLLGEVWGRGDFEIALAGQQPQGGGANGLLRRFYKTGGSQNGGRLSDRQLDDLIEKQAAMVDDPEGRKRVLQDIQRRVIELAVVLPIYASNNEAAIWPVLQGYVHTPSGGDYSRWETAWLDA